MASAGWEIAPRLPSTLTVFPAGKRGEALESAGYLLGLRQPR